MRNMLTEYPTSPDDGRNFKSIADDVKVLNGFSRYFCFYLFKVIIFKSYYNVRYRYCVKGKKYSIMYILLFFLNLKFRIVILLSLNNLNK